MAPAPRGPHLHRLISRRFLLGRTAVLAAAAGGFWWLRDRVIWPAPRPAFAGGGGSGWLDLQPDLLVPMVEATVNGRPVRALVDSGAQASVVDRAFADTLGALSALAVPMMAFGVSGKPQAGHAATVDVRLGDLALPKLHVAALDLGALAPLRGDSDAPAVLVVGQDVLRTLVLELDYPSGRLAFHPAGAAAAGGVSVPARKDGEELVVDVAVEGFATAAVLDTGLSAALALSEELASAAGLLGAGRRVRTTRSVTLGGAAPGREVLAETLSFGGRTLHEAPVAVYARPAVSLIPRALLGSGALRRSTATLDLGGGRLWLGPVATPLGLFRTE